MILFDTTTNSDNPVYYVFWAGGLYLLNKFLFLFLLLYYWSFPCFLFRSTTFQCCFLCLGNHQIIKFDHITANIGTAYNSESGIFEAPSSGMYLFHWLITNDVGSYMNSELYSNGKVYGKAMSDAHDHADRAVAGNIVILQLDKGDQVWIRSGTEHNGKIVGGFNSTFSGYRLF